MSLVKKLSETKYEVKVEKLGEEAKKLRKHVLSHFKNVKVDGFRPGKVPADVIKREYKNEINDEILNHLIHDAYTKAVADNNLKPIANIKLEKFENEEEKIEVVFTIPVLPEFELGQYKGIEVEKEKLNVTEEKVNEEIERLRENAAKLKEVEENEEAKLNDVANIDFEGFIDGVAFNGGKAEGFDLTLGSKSFIDTFEDQIVGHKKGEEFDVNVTFPENYGSQELAGKPAVFKIKLNSIKRKEEAELNEDFAKEQGYDSLEDLKAKTKEDVTKREEARIENEFRGKVLEKVVENTTLEVPEELVENEIQNKIGEFSQQLQMQGFSFEKYLEMSGQTIENMRESIKDSAEKTIKGELVFSKISEVEKIEATNEEIEAEFDKIAEMYRMEKSNLVEELRKAGNYERFVDNTKFQILHRKTIELIINEAKAL